MNRWIVPLYFEVQADTLEEAWRKVNGIEFKARDLPEGVTPGMIVEPEEVEDDDASPGVR